jgi:RNA polymerase sigma-70 factor (ECF subfamily)
MTTSLLNDADATVPANSAAHDDTELLQALRAGDPRAIEMFVRRLGPQMLTIAKRLLHGDQDAADAVQDAFLSAIQAIARFEGESSLSTWLHRITVNACLMKLRASARRPVVSMEALCPRFDDTGHPMDPAAPWSEQPLIQLERAEARKQVRQCIDRLPDAYRTVLLLRDIEELDTEQTAELLGVSTAVVKTRLHRARQALRTLLEPLFAL